MPGPVTDRDRPARDQQARPRRVRGGGGRPHQALALHHLARRRALRRQVEEDVVGEPGLREVEQGGHRLHGVLALGGRTHRPVQLARPEPQPVGFLLGELGGGDVPEEPPHPERNRLLRQRRGEPQEPAAPAPPPLTLRRTQRHPQLGRGAGRAFGEHVLQGRLQLLDTLDHQLTERPAEEGGAATAERTGGVRVDHGRAEVDVDEHHAPRRVLKERLAQRDGPLQVDLGVHLAERAVHPGRLAVGAQHPGGLGPHEHPAAVLAQQGELVDLAPGRVHGGHQPPLHLVRVGPAHRPPGEARTPHGLLRGPAEDALGLAVPVGDHTARVEGAERGVHAVEEGGEQLGPGVGGGSPSLAAAAVAAVATSAAVTAVTAGGRRLGAHGLPRAPGALVGSERVGGTAAPGSTHSVPPAERVGCFPARHRAYCCTSDHSTRT